MDGQTIQEVVNKIQQETGKPQQTPHLLQNLETLPAQVKKVLTVKYAAKPFAQLSEVEQDAHSIALLLKINVVTGWPVPDSNEEQNILAEQLKLYLIENWPLYNVEEIMYAMRSYATVLSNWGKNMNLSLIGKALADYEAERSDISALEESKIPQTNNLLTMAADFSELAEIYYQDYLKGTFNIAIMPAEIYEVAIKYKYVSEDAYEDFLQDAVNSIVARLTNEREQEKSVGNEREVAILNEQINKVVRGDEPYYVEHTAKKLAISYLYRRAKRMNKKQLF